MQKSDYLHHKKLNPADELRDILTGLEQRQTRLKSMDASQVLDLFQDLDQAYTSFQQLESTELDLQPEQGRFNTVQARFKQEASRLLKTLGGPAMLSEYRPTPPPDPSHWWWYIHELVAAGQQRLLRSILTTVGVVLLIVAGVILVFNTVLAPSPEAVARVETENKVNAAIEQVDYEAALRAVEIGLEKVPNDPGILIYKGILHQLLGEQAQADEAFRQAQAQTQEQPLNFYIARSQIWLRANQPELAEQDARFAATQDENLSRAWLLLGQALQMQNRSFEAIPIYEKAGQVALDNGESEIVVLSRLAIGQIGASAPELSPTSPAE